MNQLRALNDVGYEVSYDGDVITIIRPNQKNLIGIILILISCLLIVLTIGYLTVYETGFHPLLFRLGISVGILLFLIGLGIRSKRNSNNTLINLKSRQLSIGDSKSWEEGVKFKYAFDKISNPRFITWKKQLVYLVEIKKQDVVLFKFKKNTLDDSKMEQLISELKELFS